MRKPRTPIPSPQNPDDDTPNPPETTKYYDTDLLREMATQVAAEGFIPADVLLERFGPTRFTQGIAILFRQYRMFRESVEPWGEGKQQAKGYKWADRRFSTSQAKHIPVELGFLIEMGKGSRPKYSDFELVTVKCRWTNWVLGAFPKKDDEGDLHIFRRDADGNVLVLAYNLRGMAKVALPMISKEASIAYRIGFATVVVTGQKVEIKTEIQLDPIIDDRNQGLGIKRSEVLPPGTEFTIEAMVPTSALTVGEYVRMLVIAGKFVHLSPARHTGYGDFELLT